MKSIQPQPYKLFNKIQNYEWGTKNDSAFIPKFLGINTIEDLPYAELWIGAHPKAPSEIEIEGEKVNLNEVIEKFPIEILGKEVFDKYGPRLPFLLKVLSAGQALSIQLHPNKKQAELLHQKDSKNYPDDNHKPEIAIAIDQFTAIDGFCPAEMIKENFIKYPELKDFVGEEIFNSLTSASEETGLQQLVKRSYILVMENAADSQKLEKVISAIVKRITSMQIRTEAEEQFLLQQTVYGNDVGLLSFFFLNFIQLAAGQAIFTGAGVPHAYLKGNIIECMANSDNVVRAGLTPKFKDVGTLLEIMNYNCAEFDLINKNQKQDDVFYITSAEEFEVSAFQKSTGNELPIVSGKKPIIVLILEGTLEVIWKLGDDINQTIFTKGESFLIPALLSNFVLFSKENSKYYLVTIPE